MNMSNFQRLKVAGVFAGVVLFFVINKLFSPSGSNEANIQTYKSSKDITQSNEIQQNINYDKNEAMNNEVEDKIEEQIFGGNSLVSYDDYTNFLINTSDADLQDPFVHRHRYNFLLNNKHACNGNVFVVALVHSAPHKKTERQDIRNTWGSVRFYSGAVIVPLFLLAKSENTTLQKLVIKESEIYRDIIQGNFIDSYRNLTYKNVMGLHWVRNYCANAKFFLKTDDDTMVDIYHLIHFLFQKSPDGNLEDFLYCSTFKNQGPRRVKGDKWFVSEAQYPYRKYPPYCEGFAYVMSSDVTKKLYEASTLVKLYWIDDVYVTGFLALKTGIYHRDFENGHAFNLMTAQHLSKHAQSSIFLLAKYENLRKNWKKAWSDIQVIHKMGE